MGRVSTEVLSLSVKGSTIAALPIATLRVALVPPRTAPNASVPETVDGKAKYRSASMLA